MSADYGHFSRAPADMGSTRKMGEYNQAVLGGLSGY